MGLCGEAVVAEIELQHQTFGKQRSDLRAEVEAEVPLTVEEVGAVKALLFADGVGML